MPLETSTTVRLRNSDAPRKNIYGANRDFQREEKAEKIHDRPKDGNGKSSSSVAALNASFGQNENVRPDASVDIIRMRNNAEVRGHSTLSRSTIDRLMRANRFPQSVSVSKGSVKFYGHEVDKWLLSRPRSKNGLVMKGIEVTGPIQMLTIEDVTSRIGLSRSAIYREVKANRFLASVKVTAGRTAWYEHDLNAWLAALTAPKLPVVTK